MRVKTYLHRIGYNGSQEPTLETLRQLHRAHLLSVPFENLDIHLGNTITLSLPAFYKKIVDHRRGGFCYELNGLFGWLLGELGFHVEMLSAQVFDGATYGAEFDHLVLLIALNDCWIADVGFGDLFSEPLRLDSAEEIVQDRSCYRFQESGSRKILLRKAESGWEPQYMFSLTPRHLAEFSAMCDYHQTSANSHFTRSVMCSRMTTKGRITLAGSRLIKSVAGQREEREIGNRKEYKGLLKRYFDIELDAPESIDKLLDAIPVAGD